MAKTNNQIREIEYYKGVTIVRLRGGITYANLKDIQNEFALKTKGKKIRNILFDIKEVTDADTSGVAVLVDLFKYMKTHQSGEYIGLINLSQRIKDLLRISKTEALFNEYSSEEEAIENLK